MKTKKTIKIKSTTKTIIILTTILFFELCFNLLDFDFGDEASAAAFPITNCTDLQNMKNDLSADYYLTNDIDCSGTVTWNGGAGFEPIVIFEGNFNGHSYKIKNLYINRPSTKKVGLFARTNNLESVIKNVVLENVNIIGESHIGGLVGINKATISNSYSTGNITAGDSSGYIGGLVGANPNSASADTGTINNCHSTVNITAGDSSNYIGGLVGINKATISNSYSTGNITAGDSSGYIGGLVGTNPNSASADTGIINNCHSTGNITAGNQSPYIGGLVGINKATISNSYSTGNITAGDSSGYIGGLVGTNPSGTISNSYSTGNIDIIVDDPFLSTVSWVGGLVGISSGVVEYSYSTGNITIGGDSHWVGGLMGSNPGAITNSYWDIETSGQSSSDGGEGKTTAEMKQQATFVGWNFINIWDINEGITYPFLQQALCSGLISLNLAPNPSTPSASITVTASGLSDCNGKTIRIKQDSCSGTEKCNCSALGEGCSCPFTAPSTEGDYTYYACIDKNDDSDYWDSGEKDSEVLTVELDCAFEGESCSSISCCSSPPAPEPLICVDNICRTCTSLSCSADDAEDHSISEMGDSIDDIYCTWNIHDGCLVKEGVEIVDGGNNPSYWEGENCFDSGSSDLWGEKKVYIDDINDYNIIATEVCVDDYNFFWINGVRVNVLELGDPDFPGGQVGCARGYDVRSFFQTGWNTIKFKAVDTCSGNRLIDIGWRITPRAPALNGNASSPSKISLTWSDRGTGVTYGLWNSDIGAYIYNGDQTSFIHEGLDSNTTYSYKVIATKNSYTSHWSNTVSATTFNDPPIANAGLDQSAVIVGSTANLDGSGSNDPDGDPITYDWTFNSIPGASSLTDNDFFNETIVNSSFTPDVIGVYLIELKVTDVPFGGFGTDTVSITVANPPPICGNDKVEGSEECDGTDKDACGKQYCIPQGDPGECTCQKPMPEWKEVHPKTD